MRRTGSITASIPTPYYTSGSAPSDLVGYHVEMAGSEAGPWERLTLQPWIW
jgi:hypothetical protein